MLNDQPTVGIAQEPDAIRLAGRRVLSIDSLKAAAHLATPEPAVTRRIDWKALAAGLNLSPLETRVFLLHWGQGVPISGLPDRLRISAHTASKLYTSVRAKLGIGGQTITGCLSLEPVSDSLRLVHRERLSSGLQVSSLAKLDETFLEIMRAENYFSLISQRDPREFQKPARICARSIEPQIKGAIIVSLEKHKEENARLGRIGEKLHSLRRQTEETTRELVMAEAALESERSQAVLEEREPNLGALEKKLAALQTAQKGKRAELSATEAAHKKQSAVVEGIQEKLKANRRTKLIDEARPLAERFISLLDECGKLAVDIQLKLAEDQTDYYLQLPELVQTGEHEATLAARNRMLHTLARFYGNELTLFNPTLRRELCRRYPNRMPENWERTA